MQIFQKFPILCASRNQKIGNANNKIQTAIPSDEERETQLTILMISNEGSFTGAPIFLERLAAGLIKPRSRVAIFFSGGGSILTRMRADGFEVYSSEKRSLSRNKFILICYRFIHYLRFVKTLWLVKPDIVYSNTIVNCGETLLSKAFGLPIIVHMHEGMNFAKMLKRKLAIQVAVSNDVLVGSEYAGRVLYSLTGKEASVVPIGVSEISVSDTGCMHNLPSLIVGILGTIDENKGQLIALEALALAVDSGMNIRLIIAGSEVDSAYSFKLRNFIKEKKLENFVVFLGRIDRTDSFFQAIDVLAMCSYDEVFPTVILEAMREKKLVVATRVGGIPEIIEHGSTGFLYEAGNGKELLECLKYTLERNDIPEIIERARLKFLNSYEISNSISVISKKLHFFSKK